MLRAIIRTSSILLLCALPSLTAEAQTTVTNPKVVEFDPSADHAAVSADGQSMVSRYDLQIYLQGATQPVSTASLGKPAPAADGKIRVDFSTILVGWPLADGQLRGACRSRRADRHRSERRLKPLRVPVDRHAAALHVRAVGVDGQRGGDRAGR